MKSLHIPIGVKRVLIRTLNTARRLMWEKEFDTSYVGFTKDGAQLLVDNADIKLVCKIKSYIKTPIFMLCFSLCKSDGGKEIILVEGLKLDNIEAVAYTVNCLALRGLQEDEYLSSNTLLQLQLTSLLLEIDAATDTS
ncbi:hypothetical protein ACET3Z_030574 [Daucus carota]